ncbi:MAG: phosphoenolpyruvate--protein phosphotransferase [Chloroflexi bacterium]|nr:phosphoenolpyruvate--protein phosphotransferase [Chloroflexota bacterium]
MLTIQGIPASTGIAIGPAYIYKQEKIEILVKKAENADLELERLKNAMIQAETELATLQETAQERAGEEEARIFEAHALMLADPSLQRSSQALIKNEAQAAEAAIYQAGEGFAKKLEQVPDELIQQRAIDIRDVVQRVLRILTGKQNSGFSNLVKPSVIFADDLTPSDTIQLDKEFTLGIYTKQGSRTSHAAILARSLGIPAVMGGELDLEKLTNGLPIILDGEKGLVQIEPSEKELQEYDEKRLEAIKEEDKNLLGAADPAQTTDGVRVEVAANIGGLADAQSAQSFGAEGVGLLRTEFLFLERLEMPSEEEQFKTYRDILEALAPHPVILRTLDIGGDKHLPYFSLPDETNPFLGLRAARLCFERPELWIPQLRAALRAGYGHKLRLMFPMIANLAELRRAKSILEACKEDLRKEKQSFAEDIEIGIMVEIPSAALNASVLAPEVDFFSIGTNDLAQYTFAADRMNPEVAEIANPLDPALLRLIKYTIEGAHEHGKWVGMCGELAGDLLAIPILLGMGLDEFSMNSRQIPAAKALIRQLSLHDCQEIAERALAQESAEKVNALSQAFIQGEGMEEENIDLLLSQVILPEAVDFNLNGLSKKEEVITHLAKRLEEAGALSSAEEFIPAVYEREKQGPTYMNFQVAFPHARSASVLKAAVAFGRSESGIQYDSDFGGGVANLIFLIAIPEEMKADAYINVLKRLARLLMQQSFRDEALAANDYASLIEAVKRGEVLVED